MADGFKIADGYLDIEADTKAATRDIFRFFKEVDGELAAEEQAFKESGKKSGKAYTDQLADSFEKHSGFMRSLPNRVFNSLQEEARKANIVKSLLNEAEAAAEAERVGRTMRGRLFKALGGGSNGGKGTVFSRMFRGAENALGDLGRGISSLFSGGKSLFSGLVKGIGDAFSEGLSKAQEIWKGASKVFENITSFGGQAAGIGQMALMGLLIPTAIGLAGALTHLAAAALALPAALGVLVAAIAPAIVAFHGFGEAVGAGLSGDVEKFNEALKGLTPSARSVAKELVALKPAFSAIKRIAQESLFTQLVGQFSKLGNTLLPALATGMGGVAGALGHLISLFIGLMSAPDTIRMINDLFYTTTRIIDTLAGPLINLFGGFFRLMDAGLPWVLKFTQVLADGLQAGADWLTKITGPGGEFTGWMERAWNVGKQLWDVLKGLGQYAGTLLSSFGDEGTDTLTGMANALAKMNAYLKTSDGQETLHNLGVLIHWAGNAFVFLLDHATQAWRGLNMFFNFVRGIGPFFSNLWSSIVSGAQAVGNWFVWLGTTIWGAITTAASAVGSFFVMLWNGLSTGVMAIVGFGKMILDWFATLPGLIGDFLSAVPGIIQNQILAMSDAVLFGLGYLGGLFVNFWLVQLPGWLTAAWNWITATVSGGIAATVAAWQAFPGQVMAALSAFWGWITGAFSAAWDWVKMVTIATVNDLVSRAHALPGQIMGGLRSLGSVIGGAFRAAWDWATREVSNGVNSVMNFVNSLPGRIKGALSGAASWLYSVGKDMLSGLVNGLEGALGWAIDRAKAIAGRIKDGFLSALDIGSPSKVMQKEVGRWILPGVIRGMEDTMPSMERYLGQTAGSIRDGMRAPLVNVAAPNVSVGGVTLLADLGDGIRRAIPVVLMDNAPTVAAAANVGNKGRAGWTNTGRAVITSAGQG